MRQPKTWKEQDARDVFFMDALNGRLCWFGGSYPIKGDFILWPMQSGKTGKFLITESRTPSDPGDQTFLTMQFTGEYV